MAKNATNVIVIRRADFIQLVRGMKGCKECTIRYTTPTESFNGKLKGGRQNPYYNRVNTATESIRCQIGKNFENAVNNRITTPDTTFEAGALRWGEWDSFPRLIAHKGNFYIRYYIECNTITNITYYLDGEVASDTEVAAIKATFYPKRESKTQAAVGVVGKKQVNCKDINVKNIVSVSIDKKIYILTD